VRRFSAEYLAHTRRGLWADREALAPLSLESRRRVVDVGCGTGALTRVLREESDATVVGLDADRALLDAVEPPTVLGDATRLPIGDGTVDLVICQALLINLPEPVEAVREFARASSDLVAVIEPDNAAVEVESTVAAEPRLSRRAREAYAAGLGTGVGLGADVADLFETAGLGLVATTRHAPEQTIEPPYDESALAGAARKASGERIDEQRAGLLAGDMDLEGYDAFREDWRAMGRAVVEQMRAGTYERTETVPFYVSVARV
jgi:SAM-dependent methyltransferase